MKKTSQDSDFHITKALLEAKKSLSKDEVPVGAIIVKNDKIIAVAHNLKESKNDVTAHAEILAIRKATKKLKDWRLNDCILYTTLEPCPMCAGAIIHSRIKKVVFGAKDLRWGAAGTIVNLFKKKNFNHQVEVEYLENKNCAQILKTFFKQKR